MPFLSRKRYNRYRIKSRKVNIKYKRPNIENTARSIFTALGRVSGRFTIKFNIGTGTLKKSHLLVNNYENTGGDMIKDESIIKWTDLTNDTCVQHFSAECFPKKATFKLL